MKDENNKNVIIAETQFIKKITITIHKDFAL